MTDEIKSVSQMKRFHNFSGSFWVGTAYFCSTSIIVWLGVLFSTHFIKLCPAHACSYAAPFFDRFVSWDGEWYVRIANEGYFYDPNRISSINFFPAFPLLGRFVASLFQIDPAHSLILTSTICGCAAFALIHSYVKERWPDQPPALAPTVLLLLGLYPTTLYFRMGYTESLFLLLTVSSLYGMLKNWPLWIIATIVGVATCTRTVGVALIAPLAIHILESSQNLTKAMLRFAAIAPIALSGLIAFTAYSWITFNEPLAYIKASQNFNYSEQAPIGLVDKLYKLVTMRPLLLNYDRSCNCYWGFVPLEPNPFFNLRFAVSFYYIITLSAVAYGVKRKWLNLKECVLSFLLLAIPYTMHADRVCMDSEARYASIIFPFYLVVGRILLQLPPPLVAALGALSTVYLAGYTILFASWYSHY